MFSPVFSGLAIYFTPALVLGSLAAEKVAEITEDKVAVLYSLSIPGSMDLTQG